MLICSVIASTLWLRLQVLSYIGKVCSLLPLFKKLSCYVEDLASALIRLDGAAGLEEMYMTAGLKGRESRGLEESLGARALGGVDVEHGARTSQLFSSLLRGVAEKIIFPQEMLRLKQS